MNEPEVPEKKGWGCLQWGVVIGLLILLVLAAMPGGSHIDIRTDQMKAASNARQIIGLQLTYASDYGGQYTDEGQDLNHLTANAAFRRLVQEGWVTDETIFGCPRSRFMPDKNLGTAPDYDQALTSGENHWMMVAGMNVKSPAYYPLVMENTVDTSWPPTWFADKEGKPVRGRTWAEDTITVGFNDASVLTVKLVKKGDRLLLPKRVLEPEGKTALPAMKLLDIEVINVSYTDLYPPKNEDPQRPGGLPPLPPPPEVK